MGGFRLCASGRKDERETPGCSRSAPSLFFDVIPDDRAALGASEPEPTGRRTLSHILQGSDRMLAYITVGADDVRHSGRFYAAILTPLGYVRQDATPSAAPDAPGRPDGLAAIYVRRPYDGKAATVGNGSMAAFRAGTHEMVRSLHAAGLAAGGSDEGAPGFRDAYSDHFYVGYLRDPLGNKVAIFCSDPAEGTRGR